MRKTEQKVIDGSKAKGVTYIRELIALIEMRKKLCEEQGINEETIKGRAQHREIVRIRMAFVSASHHFCEKVTDIDIAALVGRDHAIVTYYVQDETGQHHADIAQDEKYAAIYDRAREILNEVYLYGNGNSEVAKELGLDLAEKYAKAEEIAIKIIDNIPNGLVKLENFYRMIARYSRIDKRKRRGSFKGFKEVVKGL